MTTSDKKNKSKSWFNPSLSRRRFIQAGSVLASAAAFGPKLFNPSKALSAFGDEDPVESADNIKYSVCLVCHSACGIRCKVADGILTKIDGNPYHPNCMLPEEQLPYETDPSEAYKTLGKICAKGQAGIEVVYNPYRIKQPLKRVGERGSGQWQAISWDEAYDEIATQLAEARDLETPVDASEPLYGPKANQVVLSYGRWEHGQKEFTDRLWKSSYGTINYRHDHTSICEVSHHVAYSMVSGKTHLKPDILFNEYIIFFGTSPLEANFPMQSLGQRMMKAKRDGGDNFKYVVVDPRFTNSAAKAVEHGGEWIPIKPGADGAFAMGMLRWIIENDAYDSKFLTSPSKAASGEKSWSDATWLVNTITSKFVAVSDVDGLAGTEENKVASVNGSAVDYETVESADLEFSGNLTIDGKSVLCKSVFSLLKAEAETMSIDEYEKICGVDAGTIARIAQDFTSHGKKAAAEFYRGPAQHTNGTYNCLALIALNVFMGNIDHKGGTGVGGHWHETGGKTDGQVSIGSVPDGVSATGVSITREAKSKAKYEDTNEFATYGYDGANGHPKRPWFPHATAFNYQEVLPSIKARYPYPIKVLMTYWNDWAYSTPAMKELAEEVLTDTTLVPNFYTFDIDFGETTVFADIILPDTTFLERWSTPHISPAIPQYASAFRQPVVGDLSYSSDYSTATYTPFLPNTKLAEDIHLELFNKVNEKLAAMGKETMPGLGANAFDDGDSLDTAWDWYRKILDNFVDEYKEVDGKTATRASIVDKGGLFRGPEEGFDGDFRHSLRKTSMHLYVESLATAKDSMTGNPYTGLAKFEPVKDSLDREIDFNSQFSGYPYTLITYKQAFHSMARTITQPTLVAITGTNYVEMNASDAAKLGIQTGDMVRVTSPTGSSAIGPAKTTEGLVPGVVAIAHSYGHWEMSSRAQKVGSEKLSYDSGRAVGIAANPLMQLDPFLGDVCMQDKVGGSSSFYDSRIKIEKA
jgi:anaerobic selenocysteine-containing dehydrogenase